MKNQEIAEVFYEIATLLEMEDEPFKPRAYRKAAQNIESLTVDIEEIAEKNQLEAIPGVGKNIASKIREYLETGTVKKLEELRKKTPVDIKNLMLVEGLGPKKIVKLYKELKIKNLDDLEKAAKSGKIRDLGGFGEKTERNILENIVFARQRHTRFLLGYALPEAYEIVEQLKKHVKKIEIAGSLRRKKETVGDVDILAVSDNPDETMKVFTSLNKIEKVIAVGETKSSIRLTGGLQVDLRIVEDKSFGSALQYFTGSKNHNIEMRKIAIKKGFKLNEYGLFRKEKQIAGENEKEVYNTLKMEWIPPELRENQGEIEQALKKTLPEIVNYEDVKGDLQMHTKWSDGANTVEEMVKQSRMIGHKFIAITDHVGKLRIAGALNKEQLMRQKKEIEKIREKYDDMYIFHGVEANIKKDGDLDVTSDLLKEADVVLASIHSAFRMDKKNMTTRIIKAIENKYVDIIAHPTCRIINKREPIQVDMEKVLLAARDNEVAMEINAYPDRLDLNDVYVKMAVENHVKLSIGTDSHSINTLHFYQLGTAMARRGWAKKNDVINTYSVKKLKKLFAK